MTVFKDDAERLDAYRVCRWTHLQLDASSDFQTLENMLYSRHTLLHD